MKHCYGVSVAMLHFFHNCLEKNRRGSINSSISMPFWRLRMKGLSPDTLMIIFITLLAFSRTQGG